MGEEGEGGVVKDVYNCRRASINHSMSQLLCVQTAVKILDLLLMAVIGFHLKEWESVPELLRYSSE